MIDPDGEEWLSVNDAAADVRVRPGTILVWVYRNTIRSVTVGAHRYVNMVDVRHAETDWRHRLLATR